jgi:aryl-alcohol dehydrogenase-like predicted oxidoreductase
VTRIGLGTAQLGSAYGVSNQSGKVGFSEASSIIRTAHAAGMAVLDTAGAYGDSEEVLGRVGVDSWRVVTKLTGLGDVAVAGIEAAVSEQIERSLRRLRVDNLDAVLLHRSSDGDGDRGRSIRRVLEQYRGKGLIGAIGVSIYDPTELDVLWSQWRPEIVQAPFNVFDRRLERSGWLDRLASEGCRVHFRSAFLQGLLLMPKAQIPRWFSRWSLELAEWHAWCAQRQMSPLQATLAFATSYEQAECTIIGVQSTTQLVEVLAAAESGQGVERPDFNVSDPEILEPSRWGAS